MNWLVNFNIYIQGLILSSIIVGFLILTVTFLHVFKIKIPKERLKYLYAFSSGFLLVTAIVGQWVTARHKLTSHWEQVNEKLKDTDPSLSQTTISIIILVCGIIVGSLMAFGIKKLSTNSNHTHSSNLHSNHQHDKNDKHAPLLNTPIENMHEIKTHNDRKAVIYMILTHRLPAGLILGILLVNFNSGSEFAFASLLAFILHIIPELIIIYYARIENGDTRVKSLIFSLTVKFLLIPFIFLGILISNYIDVNSSGTFWIIPFMLAIAGIVMIWGSIFELGPLFIHSKDNVNEMYKLIFTFIIGLTLSMSIQFIHVH